jgi:hypothetical protein
MRARAARAVHHKRSPSLNRAGSHLHSDISRRILVLVAGAPIEARPEVRPPRRAACDGGVPHYCVAGRFLHCPRLVMPAGRERNSGRILLRARVSRPGHGRRPGLSGSERRRGLVPLATRETVLGTAGRGASAGHPVCTARHRWPVCFLSAGGEGRDGGKLRMQLYHWACASRRCRPRCGRSGPPCA